MKDIPLTTLSGLPLKPFYSPADVNEQELQQQAQPGKPPFTRGIHAAMYRERFWTIRQYAGYATARETNLRWKKLLASGATGLSTAFDLPTQLGLDPDHPRALGEVGKVGVSIASVDDFIRLCEGIDLGRASISMTINAPAVVLLAFLQVAAEELGFNSQRLRGTLQNDILKEFAARNNFIFPPKPSLELAVDAIEHCSRHLPEFYPISVSGYHLREAGCTAPMEIAFTLANALEYLRSAKARGIAPVEVGRRLSFFFSATTDVLEEVAKFRAARRLWSALMEETFQVADEKASALRFHCQTAGSLLTARDAENNLARVALQGLAAVLGGCQSLHTNAYDEALGLPGEHSAQLAAATQLILAYETGIANTVDPLGGAYAVEALTDTLEAEARQWLAQIEKQGGAAKAIEAGYYQRCIAEEAFKYQRAVEQGERPIVGVNCFASTGEIDVQSVQCSHAGAEEEARAALRKTRADRDDAAAQNALAQLESAARAGAGRMDAIVAGARARCTLGEMCGVLKNVYGEKRA